MPTGKKKVILDPKKRAAHERSLEKRRERHRLARTVEMASKAAEGASDFETLVEAERIRIEGKVKAGAMKGAATSPKIMSQAREDLAMAFDLMGGVPALVVWGRQNPTDFYRLWSKLVPSTAQEATTALPLEMLLEKLATKEEKTVAQAAMEIGNEVLQEGKKAATAEDIAGISPNLLN